MKRSVLLLAFLAAGCARAPYASGEPQTIDEPEPDDVASVLFLVGDAGDARIDGSPLFHRLRRDVERWSAALATDSAVTVLFLGDNVYPAGVHDPGSDDFARDTAHLGAQAWTVDGPEALRHATRAIFLAGNHDWGNMAGLAGEERLRIVHQTGERMLTEVTAAYDAAGRGAEVVAFLDDMVERMAGADLVLDFDFQNGPDGIVLRSAAGVVDAIGYGVFGPSEFFAGEGLPAPDVPAGSSLARRFANVDTDDNAADWVALATPTPGVAPLQTVPEPSAGALFALGLVAIANRARGRRAVR